MSSKMLFTMAMVAGSLIGGYIPVLFGDSGFSFISLFTSGLGGAVGIYLAYRISR